MKLPFMISPRVEDVRTISRTPDEATTRTGAARGKMLGRLFAPVDIASLVFFRIAFGAVMLWEVWRYFSYGWIGAYYIDPVFHFSYYGFGWVQPWPGNGMYLHFLALGVLAGCVMLGLFYRVATALFFLGFSYVFLLEQTLYLNHFYLICLVSLLMIFVPAHRAFSMDALRKPEIRSRTVPAWALWILAAQMAIAYFYGGLAKLNADWLQGEPMRMWLSASTDFPVIGSLFTREWAPYLFSYGGLLFDLLIVPLLLWRKTRMFAFAAAVGFHVTNAELFQIGIFPWLAIAATTLFLPPSWPRRLANRLSVPWLSREYAETAPRTMQPSQASSGLHGRQYAALALLGIFLAVQLLVPLRHHLYPGNANWTEEGHRFAWHMKLRDVQAEATFYATDPDSGEVWELDPERYLTGWQAGRMAPYPDMILQFSHHIADAYRQEGYEDIEIRAEVMASLNGREPQPLVDPDENLAQQSRTLAPSAWILPLEQPLDASVERGR